MQKLSLLIVVFGLTVQCNKINTKSLNEGEIEWEKSFGGSDWDEIRSIQQTTDDGYIMAGFSKSSDDDLSENKGDVDYWILKLSEDGSIEWSKSYGGSNAEMANSIQQTKDGGYIIAGWSNSSDGDVSENKGNRDYWILKLDADGDLEWEKSYGGSNSEMANSIQLTKEGGYIVAGWSSSSEGDISESKGFSDYWILKLDADGDLEWEKSYGGSGGDEANSIQLAKDGGYIVAGSSRSSDGDVSENKGNFDCWILKLDADGSIEWEKTYGGSDWDEAKSISQALDGGYIVAGSSISYNGDVSENKGDIDCWILKLDAGGSIEWEKSYGGTNSEVARSIQQTMENSYLVVGYCRSSDGDVSENKGNFDCWILKLKGKNQTSVRNEGNSKDQSIILLKPNILQSQTVIEFENSRKGNVKLEIYNSTGTKVKTILNEFLEPGRREMTLDLSDFATGRYYIQLSTPTVTKTEILEVVK